MSIDANVGYVHRLKLLEQKVEVMQSEINQALNEFATTIQQLANVHKMFTIYVDTNLQELREKAGLKGETLMAGVGEAKKPEDPGVEL